MCICSIHIWRLLTTVGSLDFGGSLLLILVRVDLHLSFLVEEIFGFLGFLDYYALVVGLMVNDSF